MGNCFGKPKSENFSGSSQTLANSSANAPKPVTATTPLKPKTASYSPTPAQGRTVGGASTAAPGSDPRAAAALAAEERLKASQGKEKGKLGKQLGAQKAQTHNQVLDETSRDNRLARNADENAQTRTWN
ncbi:hypothetical protein E4T39_01903 [Aureobasidium subglaciale]|nr:hypothetical protein E4T39_01903 [Aureobasidium subglaciale]